MIHRDEMIERCLDTLDEINLSTKKALSVLEENAKTTSMVMEELLMGATECPHYISASSMDHIKNVMSSREGMEIVSSDDDNIEALADKIVETIRSNPNDGELPAINSLGITFDARKIDPAELLELVNKKLAEPPSEEKKEDLDEDLDFKNPIE